AHKHADTPRSLGLLCKGPKRPAGRRTNNNFDEIPPAHATLHTWPDYIFSKPSRMSDGPVRGTHVRFGSKADICSAKRHVCFTPNSDRESEIPQKAMSALPPKADMCNAPAHVDMGFT